MAASEEQAGSESGQAPVDRGRTDRERGRRPASQTPPSDQRDIDTPDIDQDGDVAPEHKSVVVGDDPINKPSESDARFA